MFSLAISQRKWYHPPPSVTAKVFVLLPKGRGKHQRYSTPKDSVWVPSLQGDSWPQTTSKLAGMVAGYESFTSNVEEGGGDRPFQQNEGDLTVYYFWMGAAETFFLY